MNVFAEQKFISVFGELGETFVLALVSRLVFPQPCWKSKTLKRFSFGKKFHFHANNFLS